MKKIVVRKQIAAFLKAPEKYTAYNILIGTDCS